MEDPTPVPNMEEVKLPKNGVSRFCILFSLIFFFVSPNHFFSQSVHNTDPKRNTLRVLSGMILMVMFLSYLLMTVNLKKDSENTPVKGGTMADLGKTTAWVLHTSPCLAS